MAHKVIWSFFNSIYKIGTPSSLDDNDATSLLIEVLNSNKPCMISRIGSTEFQTLCHEKHKLLLYPLKKRVYKNILDCSGFFPVTNENLKKFYDVYISAMKELDILVSWRFEEIFFRNEFKNKKIISKETLDDFYSKENPWTRALEGKNILVIHPFAQTIERQYRDNREKLFDNPLVLPKFKSLQTIKAVQSIARNKVDYEDWFQALEYMKSEIDKVNFDIAIIGCGAYAFPLAAYVKSLGKKAIGMGGITQFLFGIKGKRYEELEMTKKYINSYFVSPDQEDRPKQSHLVEGGCYW